MGLPQMSLQTSRLGEMLIAYAAGEWLIAGVILHMLDQFGGFLKCLPTNRALIEIGVCVNEHVFSQQLRLFEALITFGARMWLAFRMCSHVQDEAT